MTPADVADVIISGIWLTLVVSAPLVSAATGVGLLVALLQAVTQVQEMTLTFVPKVIAIIGTILLLLAFMGGQFALFNQELIVRIERLS